VADPPADQDLADRYAAYLGVCNAYDFDQLGEFVAPDVRVGGVPTGLPAYAASVARVIESFPDYHWRIRPRWD
jgi:aspartyl-tRNA synthetase